MSSAVTTKSYRYTWTEEYYLLHLQFNDSAPGPYEATLVREYDGGKRRTEKLPVVQGVPSHRILVSRSHPREEAFTVEYPGRITLEVFLLDDRAYYPTQAYYRG
ncbi:MAG TPA: hypothetical protein VIV61_04145 [Candidatus Ozemobacteraceae bacterium]